MGRGATSMTEGTFKKIMQEEGYDPEFVRMLWGVRPEEFVETASEESLREYARSGYSWLIAQKWAASKKTSSERL